MDLYGQEPEAGLLASFIPRLEYRSVIDVGAERGAFAEEMLRAGSDAVHMIEPEPGNVAFLREHFRDDTRVTVHACAVSDRDGQLRLHTSENPDGAPVTFGHTVLDRPDTDEIAWRETITVDARSLASLVEAGEIPARAGILKVDTEGHDLAVVAGMGATLECDVVMVEHWSDLPHSLGPCPWSTEEMLSALRAHGFSDFAFIVHRGEFVILQWNDGVVPVGCMGNLVFLHDRVVEHFLPAVLACASSLAERAVALAEVQANEAHDRVVVIDELSRENDLLAKAAHERLAVIEDLTRTAEERLALINELTQTADERLATIEALTR